MTGTWLPAHGSTAGQVSKVGLTGAAYAGEDAGVPTSLKPRKPHRGGRNRSPCLKYTQQEEEEAASCEDCRLAGPVPGAVGALPAETDGTAGGSQGELPVDALIEGVTVELTARIRADVGDASRASVTEAEFLSLARREFLAMAADAVQQSTDWASPAPPAVPAGPSAPEGGREARPAKPPAPRSSRRAWAPAQGCPAPAPDAKGGCARQPLYSSPLAEPAEEVDAGSTPQSLRRGGARAGWSARGSAEGNADRPRLGPAPLPEDTAPAGARRASGLLDACAGPTQAERSQRTMVTPRCVLGPCDSRRSLSPRSSAGTAGRWPRPTTPHRSKQQPQEGRVLAAGAAPPDAAFAGGRASTGTASGRDGGDRSLSPGQEKRAGSPRQDRWAASPRQERWAAASQPQVQRAWAAAAQPSAAAATPRSSARAAAVAECLDPRTTGGGARRFQASPTRGAASSSHGQAAQASRLAGHKSMSPSRGGTAARRLGSPRQGGELHHNLSPGPATRLSAESRSLAPRIVGGTPRASNAAPRDSAAMPSRASQARPRKASTAATAARPGPPAATLAAPPRATAAARAAQPAGSDRRSTPCKTSRSATRSAGL